MTPIVLDDQERRLIAAMQEGLPLVSRPYAAIAARVGMSETDVLGYLSRWLKDGTIRRMGIIVRHHELGYHANAMVVWDVPDTDIRDIGGRMSGLDFVTLCYRRPRRLPDWPYNLFCMIHGRNRSVVRGHIATLITVCGLDEVPHEVLFSRRRFKQQGARCFEAGSGQESDRESVVSCHIQPVLS